jgi:Uma2 family endonuclease
MSTQTTGYLEAAADLQPGGRLTLYDVSWEQYEQLLNDLGDDCHLRISFNDGELEIMSPSDVHENLKNLTHDLLIAISDELQQDILSFGSWTLKLDPIGKGAEADDCFYIQNAAVVQGRKGLDLAVDPPPDLVVEIDLSSQSSSKLAIYAALGVPEVWHYSSGRWRFLQLVEGAYSSISRSVAFPFISPDDIASFVANSKVKGPLKARSEFRESMRRNRHLGN